MARPSCFKLLVHWARRAASRADWTAGKSRAIRTAMMAITTSSSIRVKPRRASVRRRGIMIWRLLTSRENETENSPGVRDVVVVARGTLPRSPTVSSAAHAVVLQDVMKPKDSARTLRRAGQRRRLEVESSGLEIVVRAEQ